MKYALFVGEMLIDFIPNSAGSDETPSYQPYPGGAVANAAVALARLGGAARFVGKLGEDDFGRLLMSVLKENQVDTSCVPTTALGNTTLALVTLERDGQREFTFYRDRTADTLLEIDDLKPQAWDDVAICHAGSVLLTVDPARTATLATMDQASQRGCLVSFDVNVRPALWSSEEEIRAAMTSVIERVDLLKCSAEEAHYLDPTLHAPLDRVDNRRLYELGQKLLSQGPSLVIITRGNLGALLMTKEYVVEAMTSVPRQAVDTTGAGDAFMGAILCRLLNNDQTSVAQLVALSEKELQELGSFANEAAGISCTRYGGISSLPYLDEIEPVL